MLRRPRAVAVAGLFALVGLAGAGCGGGDPEATSTAEASPTLTVTATSPADLASYRYRVDISLTAAALDTTQAPSGLPMDRPLTIEMSGERINPDREQTTTTADLGFIRVETESVWIGTTRWIREGDRPWKEGGVSALETFAAVDFRPAALYVDDQGQYDTMARRLQDLPWADEDLDGVPVRHFTLDADAFVEIFLVGSNLDPSNLTANLVGEVWLERDRGTPVRTLIVGTDAGGAEVFRLEMRLFDLDTDDIVIEAPA